LWAIPLNRFAVSKVKSVVATELLVPVL